MDISLFHGGSADGWLALPVAVDGPAPLLVLGLGDDGSGGVYFAVTP
jgi:hypothetical protein